MRVAVPARAAVDGEPQAELGADEQQVLAQLPEEQKLIAVFQSGENEDALLDELGGDYRERYAEAKVGFEKQRQQALERQKAAEAQRAAQMQMQRGPAASNAFDVMRRQRIAVEQRQRAREAATGGDAAQRTATKPKPAAASAPKDLGPEFANAGRNDPCPCGSGKKFKKCHGKG